MDRIDIKVNFHNKPAPSAHAVAAQIYNLLRASEAPLTLLDLEEATGRGRGLVTAVLAALVAEEWVVTRDNPFAAKRGNGTRGNYAHEFTVCGREWPEGFWAPAFRDVPGRFVQLEEEDLDTHRKLMVAIKVENARRRAA